MKITFEGFSTNIQFEMGKLEIECSPEEFQSAINADVQKTHIRESEIRPDLIGTISTMIKDTIKNTVHEELSKPRTTETAEVNQCTAKSEDEIRKFKGRSTK